MELINAKIFDGEKMIEKAYVRFEGEKITDVGEMKAYKADGGEVLDLTGKTVFPGLIDAHSHLGMWNDS
ncbi:MAG: amidohydrolase, partial [Clostridia bacterium]|nr:amidohydrolase [Clostridia bacterium]